MTKGAFYFGEIAFYFGDMVFYFGDFTFCFGDFVATIFLGEIYVFLPMSATLSVFDYCDLVGVTLFYDVPVAVAPRTGLVSALSI